MLLNLTENRFVSFYDFLREAFCGLEYAENVFAAEALPRTPLGKFTMKFSPDPCRLRRGHPSPVCTPLDAYGASTLALRALRSAPVGLHLISGYATG